MKAITIKNITQKSHPQTKAVFWYLFAGSRGGQNRIQIINQLRSSPSNKHQISQTLGMEYKNVAHHLEVLEKNNVVSRAGERYGEIYFVSTFFEEGEFLFEEIIEKLKKIGEDKWSK